MKLSVSPRTLDYLLVFSIFTSGFYVFTPFGVLYYSYFIVALYCVANYSRKTLVTSFWLKVLFFTVLVWSILLVFINSLWSDFDKIFFSLFLLYFISISFYSLIYKYKNGLGELFDIYLDIATFVALIALLQEFLLIAGANPSWISVNGIFKDMGGWWGVPGLSAEPAELAIVLVPALSYSILKYIDGKGRLWPPFAIFTSIILSTSSLGILGVLVFFLLMFFRVASRRFLYLIVTMPIFAAAVLFFFSQDYFLMRVSDSLELLVFGAYGRPEGYNLSSYSQVVNFNMMVSSLSEFNYLGSGFSNYSSVYDRFISDYYIPEHRDDIPGRGTATSLLLRLVGELGVLGFFLFLGYFFRFGFLPGGNIIRISCFVFLFMAMARMGIYFANGTVFFILLYVFSMENRCVSGSSKI